MKIETKKLFGGNRRKLAGNGNQKVLQSATAAALVSGAGLAGFYAWQNAARKKRHGFMNRIKPSRGSRFGIFSR